MCFFFRVSWLWASLYRFQFTGESDFRGRLRSALVALVSSGSLSPKARVLVVVIYDIFSILAIVLTSIPGVVTHALSTNLYRFLNRIVDEREQQRVCLSRCWQFHGKFDRCDVRAHNCLNNNSPYLTVAINRNSLNKAGLRFQFDVKRPKGQPKQWYDDALGADPKICRVGLEQIYVEFDPLAMGLFQEHSLFWLLKLFKLSRIHSHINC